MNAKEFQLTISLMGWKNVSAPHTVNCFKYIHTSNYIIVYVSKHKEYGIYHDNNRISYESVEFEDILQHIMDNT